MANDKDFVVNGPIAVGKDTKVTVGTIASGAVDLSTGNYFTDSPSGDYTYTFANAGDVQSFQIEATGGSAAVAQTFSTTLYDGTGAAQDITNGLDLAGDGGLVWVKHRDQAFEHMLADTETGAGYYLSSNSTQRALGPNSTALTSFNSNGFSIGSLNDYNYSVAPKRFVSWSFKKQTKFFDVVTWTGDGNAGRTISHSLGSAPATIIIKRVSFSQFTTNNWFYHTNFGASSYDLLYLNLTSAASSQNYSTGAIQSAPTNSTFTLKNSDDVNGSGATYVAYLFAHDTASDGLIQCGSYTGNGAADGPEVNLGWSPQWILVKNADTAYGWIILDTARGIAASPPTANVLFANNSNSEDPAGNRMHFTSTGFKITTSSFDYNKSGDNFIYMAIRSPSAPAITWPSSIEWTGGSTPSTPAEGETDVYTFTTDDGGTTYTGIQSIDNAS